MNDKETIKFLEEGAVVFRYSYAYNCEVGFADLFSDRSVYEVIRYYPKLNSDNKVMMRILFSDSSGHMGIFIINNVDINDINQLDDLLDNTDDIKDTDSDFDIIGKVFKNMDQDLVLKYWESVKVFRRSGEEMTEDLKNNGGIPLGFNSYDEFLDSGLSEVSSNSRIRSSENREEIESKLSKSKLKIESLKSGNMIFKVNQSTSSEISGYGMYPSIDNELIYPIVKTIIQDARYNRIAYYIPVLTKGKIVDFKVMVINKFYNKEDPNKFISEMNKVAYLIRDLVKSSDNFKFEGNDLGLLRYLYSLSSSEFSSSYKRNSSIVSLTESAKLGFSFDILNINKIS